MSAIEILDAIKSFAIKRRNIILLFMIIIAGSYFRFPGATWGLPLRLHPDEGRIVDNAMEMASAHRYEVTGDFNHPNHTPIKMEVVLFWGMRHTLQAVSIAQLSNEDVMEYLDMFEGVPDSVQKLPPKVRLFMLNCLVEHKLSIGNTNDESLYVGAGRMLSALFGVICIILVWLIGKQIHERVGLLCALLFAVSPSFIEHSHYITPEIYQMAFSLASTYFCIIYVKNPKYKTLFFACLCAALSFCTKYAALFSFPIVIAATFCVKQKIDEETSSKNIKKNVVACLLAIVFFGVCVFAISPILLLDLPNVYVNVMIEARSSHLGVAPLGYWGRLIFYLKCYANHAGIILSAFGVIGLLYLWKENRRIFVLMLLGVLYAPITAILSLYWDRWGVPFYAFALILSAIGAWRVFEWLIAKFSECRTHHADTPRTKLVLPMALVLALLCAVSFANTFVSAIEKSIYFAVAQDTRNASVEYAAEIGATTDNTIYEGYTPLNPAYPATIFGSFENGDISKPLNPEVKYIILSSKMYARFYNAPEEYAGQIAFYEMIKANKTVLREYEPVVGEESVIEVLNIISKIRKIAAFLDGGYSGPHLIFYQY